jgi:predicted Zn-dependent protease with MMP-like domain
VSPDPLFEEVIRKTLEELPADLKAALATVEIVVKEKPSTTQLKESGFGPSEDLFGLFEGYSLKELPLGADRQFPDRVSLFVEPLKRHYPDRKTLTKEIRKTLVHELGHYFGFNEEELERRGLG